MVEETDKRTIAWLETIGPGMADTIQRDPGVTIAPRLSRQETGKRYALDILQHLSTNDARVQLERTIGQGGMGVVRRATQVSLGRTVAVKTLRPDRRGQHAILALLREAWITGSLEHPNVVPVHDIGIDQDGEPLIVLKRIEGMAWSELIDDAPAVRERFGVDDILAWNLEIFLHVCNAVRFAHSRGILHRDLKPDNVMIGEFGEVYLLDWGIAVSLQQDDSGRLPLASEAVEMAGTPCYMAPEMLGEGMAPLSERTDVYLLGSLLYQIMSGQPPHQGDTSVQILRSVLLSQPTLPHHASPVLAGICRKAMSAEPEQRYASADEVRLAVQEFLRYRGSARLTEKAEHGLAELCALLGPERSASQTGASDPARDDAAWRQSVYRLFGGCRFGFQEALSAWPENSTAERGLARAITAMAEHELMSGNPRAAEALVAELAQPPEQLHLRIEAAVRALEERGERIAELEKLSADLDMATGARTRGFITSLLASFWIITPLLCELTGHTPQLAHWEFALSTVAFAFLALGLFIWARESMTKTAINRRLMLGILLMLIAQAALHAALWRFGMDIVHTMVCLTLLWSFTAAFMSLTIEPDLWPLAIAYGLAFLVGLWQPTGIMYSVAAASSIMLITATVLWRRFRHLYGQGAENASDA